MSAASVPPAPLVHDWNTAAPGFTWERATVALNDETLRDGLQSPSVRVPPVEERVELLHLMGTLGIDSASIGFPASGERAFRDAVAIARRAAGRRVPVALSCAGRTLAHDVDRIVEVSQRSGVAIEAALFVGSSPIRHLVEGWSLAATAARAADAVRRATAAGLPVMFITEDTTRATPATLRLLFGAALDAGARRLCIADTVGHATPSGVARVVRFVRDELLRGRDDVRLDWHGHRDRGLGLANCLAAIEAGVDRVHGTALGIGERAGNAEMDLLLVNLRLLGAPVPDLSTLGRYVRHASRIFGAPIPAGYPVFGDDAFRTGTGVHASAILKAKAMGLPALADRVYSGVPASEFGLAQRIEVSPMSGLSNVRHWLDENGYGDAPAALCEHLLALAKEADRVLDDEELHLACARLGLLVA